MTCTGEGLDGCEGQLLARLWGLDPLGMGETAPLRHPLTAPCHAGGRGFESRRSRCP